MGGTGNAGNVVLTRRPGRAIWIGRAVTLTVAAVRGQQVEFALEGPAGMVATPHADRGSLAAHLRRQAETERSAMLGRGGSEPFVVTAPLSPHQPLYIGRGVIVTVVGVQGVTVEVAVEAPQDVQVSRDDLTRAVHDARQREREQWGGQAPRAAAGSGGG